MKNLCTWLIWISIIVFIGSCTVNQAITDNILTAKYFTVMNEAIEFYEKPHQLRRMYAKSISTTITKPATGSLSGGFFLGIGGISGNYTEGSSTTSEKAMVRFTWEIKDSMYVVTTLPLTRVRIKLVENISNPTVSFIISARHPKLDRNVRYKTSVQRNMSVLRDYFNPDQIFDDYLDYVIFHRVLYGSDLYRLRYP